MRSFLVTALNDALKHKLVPYNEASLSENPRVIMREMRTLTDEEAGRFLDAAKGKRFQALHRAGLYFGPRRGEICGLAWEKMTWTTGTGSVERPTVLIDQQVQRVGGRVEITPTKGNKENVIPIVPPLYQCRRDLWLAQGQPKTGLLFRGIKERSKPLDPMVWYREFKTLLKEAGLLDKGNFRGHDLRHTAATFPINNGGTTKDAADMLAHTTTRHSERYARRLTMERKWQTASVNGEDGAGA